MSAKATNDEEKPIRLPRRRPLKEELQYTQYLPDNENKSKVAAQRVTRIFDEYYLVEDRILESIKWNLDFSDENHSDNPKKITRTREIGCTVTEGSEIDTSISVSAGYAGFGFSFGLEASASYKEFSSVETSEVITVEEEYVLDPHHSLWVYKKEFTFRGRIWVWDKEKNVRLLLRSGKPEGNYSLTIAADETSEWNDELQDKVGSLVVDDTELIVPDGDYNPED